MWYSPLASALQGDQALYGRFDARVNAVFNSSAKLKSPEPGRKGSQNVTVPQGKDQAVLTPRPLLGLVKHVIPKETDHTRGHNTHRPCRTTSGKASWSLEGPWPTAEKPPSRPPEDQHGFPIPPAPIGPFRWPICLLVLIAGYALLSPAVAEAQAPQPPTLIDESAGLSLVSYGSTDKSRPTSGDWQLSFPFTDGTNLEGTSTWRSTLLSCNAGGTVEVGWYKTTALTTKLGQGGIGLRRIGPRILRRINLLLNATSAGEYRALAYCKQGTTYSGPVNLMGANGKVTLVGDAPDPDPNPDPDPDTTPSTSPISDSDRDSDSDSDPPGRSRPQGLPSIRIWTDRLAYQSEEKIRLYLDLDPHSDQREYTLFIFRESIKTGEQAYLAPLAPSLALHDEVVDQYGRGAVGRRPRSIERVEKELIWEGSVPYPGLWHFVAELRSPGTSQVLKRAYAKFVVPSADWEPLNWLGFERVIEGDLRLSSDRVYFLGDRLRVGRGATLTIEAGTVVEAYTRAAEIVVEPGARILALGRREAPVVLTCAQPLGGRSPGCWGGLKVRGRAPPSGRPAATARARPEMAFDGAEQDSSGELRYLRVEFAGSGSVSGAPSAALELLDIGGGTIIDHVQVHAALGDGFVFRGGAAHCSYCVASDVRSDSLAWDRDWRGSAQYLYVQQGAQGASAIHGRADGSAGAGRSPKIYNATLVGGYNIAVAGGKPGQLRSIGPGILLDRGVAITARNVLATGFAGFAIDGSAASFTSGRSSFSHAVLTRSGYRISPPHPVLSRFSPYVEYIEENPQLLNVRYGANPDPRPRSGSGVLQLGNAAVPPFAPKFSHSAHYVGAFHKINWLEEWTFFGPEEDYRASHRWRR